VGHQDRHRHVLEHEVRGAAKDGFADPGMSTGTHHEEIAPKIEGPHFESLAGSQARRRMRLSKEPLTRCAWRLKNSR
jgi:hypothetical protein